MKPARESDKKIKYVKEEEEEGKNHKKTAEQVAHFEIREKRMK